MMFLGSSGLINKFMKHKDKENIDEQRKTFHEKLFKKQFIVLDIEKLKSKNICFLILRYTQ